MARWVKSHNQMRIFKQAATPAVVDGLKVGDIWVDITSGAVEKLCTSISPVTFVTNIVGTNTSGLAASLSDKIIQTVTASTGEVATGTTTVPFDDTIPQNTEGDQYLTASITPSSSTHTLIITVTISTAISAGGANVVSLFQDSTADALASVLYTQGNGTAFVNVIHHVMTAGTTSSTTFNVRAGPIAAGTLTLNGIAGARKLGGRSVSRITIMEVMA